MKTSIKEAEERDEFRNEIQNENICECCGSIMTKIKKKQKNRYSKKNSIYKCESCGNQFRERTNNEILRDLGHRD